MVADGKVVGWFQGRMEWGPRALGNRSILADPRYPATKDVLNARVKNRESFRPFAPAVLAECVSDYFEQERESPYMLIVADVKHHRRNAISVEDQDLFGIDQLKLLRSDIPAVTHVDYSARIQTVHRDTNPRFHKLLKAYQERTGCPALVNTSFNVRGEPIVCTPDDAIRAFRQGRIDYLAMGPFLVSRPP